MPWRKLRYVVYAREFGWTPAQVDAIPLDTEPWLLPINYEIERDIAKKQEAAREQAEREAGLNKR